MKKKVLCLLMALALCFSAAPYVYAEDAETDQTKEQPETEETALKQETEEKVEETEEVKEEEKTVVSDTDESGEQEIENQNENVKENKTEEWSMSIELSTPFLDVLEVIQGTNLDQYGAKVELFNLNTYRSTYTPLLNSMVSGFDNSKLGMQEVTVTYQGFSTTLKVNVVEGEVPKAVRMEASLGVLRGNVIPKGYPENELKDILEIKYYDKSGNQVNLGEEVETEISKIDTSVKGKSKVTVASQGLTTEITVRIVPVKVLLVEEGFLTGENTDIIKLPIGGKLDGAYIEVAVNEDDPTEILQPVGAGGWPLLEYFPQTDTSKAGLQEYSIYPEFLENFFRVPTMLTTKISVGMPKQVSKDDILTEKAQATMPSGAVVGTWDVPSGKAGAGTWVFQTGLAQGQEVTVWSYHNEQWLKIGVYKVDSEGNVTVTFTADQLSPVLITKNETSGKTVVNTNTNQVTNKDKTVNSKAPKTGDTNHILLLLGMGLVSFCILGGGVVLKVKRD